MASLMPAIMTRTAWPGGAAPEALTAASAAAAFRTAATIVGASSAAVGTATAIIAAAVTSTAAEGALEPLARIAADACGVARKLFARRGGAACSARRAGFSRQQDDVVLGDRGCRGSGNEMVYRDVFGVGALRFFLAVGFFVMFGVMLGVMFCVGGMCFAVKFKCGVVFGNFVRGIGFRVGTIGRAAFFDLRGFVVGKLGHFGGG